VCVCVCTRVPKIPAQDAAATTKVLETRPLLLQHIYFFFLGAQWYMFPPFPPCTPAGGLKCMMPTLRTRAPSHEGRGGGGVGGYATRLQHLQHLPFYVLVVVYKM